MKRQKKYRGIQRRKAISGYMFIMPFIIGFLTFMVKPFIQSLYMSFCNVEISSDGFYLVFAGLANYTRSFTVDTEFNRMLTETIGKMTYNALAVMVFSFFTAMILNSKGVHLSEQSFSYQSSYPQGLFLGLNIIIHYWQVYRMQFRNRREMQALRVSFRKF